MDVESIQVEDEERENKLENDAMVGLWLMGGSGVGVKNMEEWKGEKRC